MVLHKRSQTATEYLIILAVVIIIALLVVSVLGGIPSIGGGASEQTVRLQLASQDVGVDNYFFSPAKGQFIFRNNQPNTIQINNVTVDGKDCWLIGSNSQPHKQPRLRLGESETISCGSITANSREDYEYSFSITYTDLKTNSEFTIDDLVVVGTASTFECPDGFIPVPGGFVLADGSTVDDFCVMKYEAKAQPNGGGDPDDDGGFADGANGLVGTHVPVSVEEGRPWVLINQTNAIAECQSQGWDLISDRQWMVIAENILNTPINDLDSSTSGPQLGNGNSNSGQSYAAGSDPVVTGCDLSVSLDVPVNAFSSTCQLRGDNTSIFGYYHDGQSNWDMMYDAGDTDSRAKLRTHVLSNGEVIWDMAGNIRDWVQGDYSSASTQTGDYSSSSNFTGISWAEPSQLLAASSSGFGRIFITSPQPAVLRSGYWSGEGPIFGIFYIGAVSRASASVNIGFRCVYEPN